MGGSDFEYSNNGMDLFKGKPPVKCNVGEEAYRYLLKRETEITEPIEIIYVIGSFDMPTPRVPVLLKALDELEQKCKSNFGVPVNRKEIYAESVLVDSRNGRICPLNGENEQFIRKMISYIEKRERKNDINTLDEIRGTILNRSEEYDTSPKNEMNRETKAKEK